MTALYIFLALPLAVRAGTGTFTRLVRRGSLTQLVARRRVDRSLIATTIVLVTSEMLLTLVASILLAGVWAAVMFAP
jgi:hypothetical protein